jgi:hypothetical protein
MLVLIMSKSIHRPITAEMPQAAYSSSWKLFRFSIEALRYRSNRSEMTSLYSFADRRKTNTK